MNTFDPEIAPEIPIDQPSTEELYRSFSHLQWYLHHSGNTVYLAAESTREFTQNDLHGIAGLFMKTAPQLNYKVSRDESGHVEQFSKLEEICTFSETDDLYASLLEILENQDEIYRNSDLPNFRAWGFRLNEANEGDVRSLYVCCSSHALMEGSESARIVRVKPSVHHAGQQEAKLSFFQQIAISTVGLFLAPFHLAASAFNTAYKKKGKWATIDIDRKSLKKFAKDLGVRQRSVLFSMPLFGLLLSGNLSGKKTKKAHLVSYSTLPDTKTTLEDTALNLRMQVGRIPTADSFREHVLQTSKILDKEDTTEIYSQAFYNSVLSVHRVMHKIFPFLYGKKFFSYIPYDFVLSLLPPHVASGPLRQEFDRSMFCGSYTPGVNNCVFVPYRNGVSLNFFLYEEAYDNLDHLMDLLKELKIDARRVL